MRLAIAVAGGAALWAFAAQAQVPAMSYANRPFPPSTSNRAELDEQVQIRTALRKLHNEAVSRQKADGGTLTEAHRAELEQKLAVLCSRACAAKLAAC